MLSGTRILLQTSAPVASFVAAQSCAIPPKPAGLSSRYFRASTTPSSRTIDGGADPSAPSRIARSSSVHEGRLGGGGDEAGGKCRLPSSAGAALRGTT